MPLDRLKQEIDPYAPPQSDITSEAVPCPQWIAKEGKYLLVPRQDIDLRQYCRYCGAISHGHLIAQKLSYIPKENQFFIDYPTYILYGLIVVITFLDIFAGIFDDASRGLIYLVFILIFIAWETIRRIVRKKVVLTLSECLYHRTQRLIMTISAYLCVLLLFMSLSIISIHGVSWVFGCVALVLFGFLNYKQRLRIVKNSETMLWLGGFPVKFRQHYDDFSPAILTKIN